ncbi:MAG: efflux RND transporter periplasmic adaptor subunit [Candidatus Methanomethylicaceae archaeon]
MQRKWLWLGFVVLIGALLALLFAQLRDTLQREVFPHNVIAVERGDITLTLDLLGELKPEKEAFLRFPSAGIVKEIFVKEGERVEAGQVLARLEDIEQRLELLRAQQRERPQLSAGMPQFPGISFNLFWDHEIGVRIGTRTLGIDWTVELRLGPQGPPLRLEAAWRWEPLQIESELERLEHEIALHQAQRALDETVLKAPFAGVVSEVRAQKGDRVTEEDSVILLMDWDSWWIEAPVTERDLARLAPGQRAIVTFEAYADLTLPAELIALHFSRPTEQTKQLQARLRLLQSDIRLLPGLTARAAIVLQEAKGVLRVPLESVVEIEGKNLVTRVREGQLEEVEVQTGLSDDRWIEIRSGLAEGDLILENNYQLYEKYHGRP